MYYSLCRNAQLNQESSWTVSGYKRQRGIRDQGRRTPKFRDAVGDESSEVAVRSHVLGDTGVLCTQKSTERIDVGGWDVF
jgi:hypothetical protein